jgi:hypothetical protein
LSFSFLFSGRFPIFFFIFAPYRRKKQGQLKTSSKYVQRTRDRGVFQTNPQGMLNFGCSKIVTRLLFPNTTDIYPKEERKSEYINPKDAFRKNICQYAPASGRLLLTRIGS